MPARQCGTHVQLEVRARQVIVEREHEREMGRYQLGERVKALTQQRRSQQVGLRRKDDDGATHERWTSYCARTRGARFETPRLGRGLSVRTRRQVDRLRCAFELG